VNGTTLTVTGQNGTSYSVDASGATASKRQTMSLSDITVGDTVNVDGTVTGNSITAKQILDGVPLGKPAQGTQP
jgi:riboflavin synthase alpha subunit